MSGHGGGGGCPLYWLTWADMITLLMTFFVVLASVGRVQYDEKYNAIVNSLHETFGAYTPKSQNESDAGGTAGVSLIKKIQQQVSKNGKENTTKNGHRDGQMGKSTTVKNIRDGLMITVGGLTLFEEGKADLLPQAEADLLNVVTVVKGYRNKILVRGHTDRLPPPKDSKFKSPMDLSYARAAAVLEFMVKQGISRDRLTIEACGGNEPVKTFTTEYDEDATAQNRRVEIVVKDQMVEDFEGSPAGGK